MLFEVINPSDPYLFEAPELEIAALAVCLVGNGRYAAQEVDGEANVPLFLLGGHDEWFQAQFGRTFEQSLDYCRHEKLAALVACLESFFYGTPELAKMYHKGLELLEDPVKQVQWKTEWKETHRSSMNDIGARAWAYAARLKELGGADDDAES